jgi:hypothetical protein
VKAKDTESRSSQQIRRGLAFVVFALVAGDISLINRADKLEEANEH